MNLGKQTLMGVVWAYSSFVGGKVVNLLTTALLTRMLFPEDFGLIGFALIILNFIEAARGFGINDALIYNTERVDDAANTAFVLNFFLGFLQFVVAFLFAPLAVHFISDPRIVDFIRIMAISFIFTGFSQTHDALLQKELKFSRRFFPDLFSTVFKGIISIGMAFAGFGPLSLVVGHVVASVARCILLWIVLPWKPTFHFYADKARELWRYGVHILVLNALSVIISQASGAIIGALLGAVQLGYFTIAARIPEMIIVNVSMVLTRIIFPAYVKIKDDREQLVRGFLKTTQYTAFITVAAGFGMASVAREIILVFTGGQTIWLPAVPLVQVLALMGMTSTLAWNAGDMLKAIGRPDISTRLLVFETIFTVALIWIFASSTGLAVMAALGNFIAFAISAIVRLIIASRFLKISFWHIISVFRGPFIAGITMFAAVKLWQRFLTNPSDLLILISSMIIGGIVYVSVLMLIERRELRKLQTIVSGMLRPSNSYT